MRDLVILECTECKRRNYSTDKNKRNAMIKEAFDLHSADIGHLPLHQQALAWGVNKKVDLVQMADNYMPFRYITVKP